MILGIEKEISIFLQAILAGNILYIVYLTTEVFRKLIRHTVFWTGVEDTVYWCFASIYLFLRMQQTCSGNIRWYFVLGLGMGSLISRYFLRKIGRKYIDKTKKTE